MIGRRLYTPEHIEAILDDLVARTEPLLGLDLPPWGARTCSEQTDWLQENFTTYELQDMFFACMKTLDDYDPEDPEWEALCEEMDPIYLAIEQFPES